MIRISSISATENPILQSTIAVIRNGIHRQQCLFYSDGISTIYAKLNASMREYLYILSNDYMPGILKIGFTKDLEQRLSGLYTTGVPGKFSTEMVLPTESGKSLEWVVFDALSAYRLPSNREFFQVDLVKAIRLIMNLYDPYVPKEANNGVPAKSIEEIKPQRLQEIEENILFMIAKQGDRGAYDQQIRDEFGRDYITLSYTLSNLCERKYIKLERRRDFGVTDYYFLIHKGLQYLKDIEMLDSNKIDEWWETRHPNIFLDSDLRLSDLISED